MTKLMVLTAVVSFAFDQISKLYVVFWLDLINLQEIDVFAPFLNFRMAWNYGVNFGLFSGQSEVQRTALILGLELWGEFRPVLRPIRGSKDRADFDCAGDFCRCSHLGYPAGQGAVNASGGGAFDWRRAWQCPRPVDLWRGSRFFKHVVLRHRKPLCF